MENNKNCIFTIKITENEKIQCSVIDGKNQMIPIELKENQVEYDCEILFDRNEIIIDSTSISNESTTNNRIRYINDMINKPEEYKKYQIEYQEKHYEVIGEVLFGLMINQFKKN